MRVLVAALGMLCAGCGAASHDTGPVVPTPPQVGPTPPEVVPSPPVTHAASCAIQGDAVVEHPYVMVSSAGDTGERSWAVGALVSGAAEGWDLLGVDANGALTTARLGAWVDRAAARPGAIDVVVTDGPSGAASVLTVDTRGSSPVVGAAVALRELPGGWIQDFAAHERRVVVLIRERGNGDGRMSTWHFDRATGARVPCDDGSCLTLGSAAAPERPPPATRWEHHHFADLLGGVLRTSWSGSSGLMHGPEHNGMRRYSHHYVFGGGEVTFLRREGGEWREMDRVPLAIGQEDDMGHELEPFVLRNGASVVVMIAGRSTRARVQRVRGPCARTTTTTPTVPTTPQGAGSTTSDSR